MPDIPTPEDLGTYLKELERRVRVMETAPRARDTEQPWASDFVETEESTSSTTNTDLATPGPEVTVYVGQTNRVLITMACAISLAAVQQGAAVLQVDGLYPSDPPFTLAPVFARNDTSAVISGSYSCTRNWTSSLYLPEGLHTFRMQYRKVSGGGSVFYSNRFLMIQNF